METALLLSYFDYTIAATIRAFLVTSPYFLLTFLCSCPSYRLLCHYNHHRKNLQ